MASSFHNERVIEGGNTCYLSSILDTLLKADARMYV
jgi:uncharacterized UBP type Zn finger protein